MLQHVPEQSREMESFPYLSELRRIYNASQSAGFYVGLTTEKKILAGDLRQRRVLVVSGAEFVPGPVSDSILRWAEEGGTVVVSPDSLLADEYARPSHVLESLGLRLARRIPPQLKRGETFVTPYNLADVPRMPLRNRDGAPFTANGVAIRTAGSRQVVEADRTMVMARFEDGSPALFRVPRGRGVVYWLASPLDPESWSPFLYMVVADAGLKPDLRVTREAGAPAVEIEHRVTTFEGRRLAYLDNDSDRDAVLTLAPAFPFQQIIDRRTETPLNGTRLTLPARETAILEIR